MTSLLFGIGVLAIFAVFVYGWRLARADALEGWDVADIALLRDEAKRKRRVGILERIARKSSPQLAVLLGPRIVSNLRRRIDLAGRPDGMTVDTFLQLVVKYFVVLGAASVWMLMLGKLVSAVLLMIAAGIMPMSRLAGARRRRQTQIDADLPDFLDVLAVTVGAGISFRSALERVSSRFAGPLREELTLTLHQLDVGVPRRQAFTQLRTRCETDAMSSFVSALLQAEELGAPLGEALTSIARDSRREAAQAARQRAARMNPRVTLVVSVILVPPTLVLIGVGMFLGADIDFGSLFDG